MSFNAAVFGHSWAFLSHSGTAPNEFIKQWGIAHAIQSKMGGDIVFPANLNFGVAGSTSQSMVDRLPAAIADMKSKGCNLVIVPGTGTNDRTSGFSVKQSKVNTVAIVHGFKHAGIDVVVLSEAPRGAPNALTGQALADHVEFYNWQVEELSKSCSVVDIWTTLVDPASEVHAPLPDVFSDGLHLTAIGAEMVADAASQAVGFFVKKDIFSNMFDVMRDSGACLTVNPNFKGTGGTLHAALRATAGSVLGNSWATLAGNFPTTLNTTFWKESVEGVEHQCIRIFGTTHATLNTTIQIYSDIDLTMLGGSDKVRTRSRLISEGFGLVGLALEQYVPANPTYYNLIDGDPHDNSQDVPSKRIESCRITPAYTHGGESTTIVLRPQLKFTMKRNAVVDVVVKIRSVESFKVIV